MNSLSHLISVLLSIGSLLGIPYAPYHISQPITLPGLEERLAPSSFSTFAPLIPAPVEIQIPTSTTQSNSNATSTKAKFKKLPILSLEAPVFKPFPFSTIPNIVLPDILPEKSQIISTPATIAPSPEIASSPTLTPIVTSSPNSVSLNLQEKAERAVVNIYCTSQSGNLITIVTGSGVIIDPRGIILTNAHVADHFLLNDYLKDPNKSCLIRRGSPAAAAYRADLIYISSSWLRLYGQNINDVYQPQETGAGDYALLAIIGTSGGASLPSTFSYVAPQVTADSLSVGTSVLGIGYPANSLSSAAVVRNLLIKSSALNITATYTFNSNNGKDLIRTNSSVIAERGSSGGGILNQNGDLIALIATTVTDSGNTSLQDLQAITLNYINSDIRNETGFSLGTYLNKNLNTLVENFKSIESSLFNYLPH